MRTGRASPAWSRSSWSTTTAAQTPLQQLAGFSVPEPRVLVIQPYDKGAIKAIEKAIQQSDLGINPRTTASHPADVPPADRGAAQGPREGGEDPAEEGRVAVRNVRRDARKELEALEKDGDLSRTTSTGPRRTSKSVIHEVDRRDRRDGDPQGARAARGLGWAAGPPGGCRDRSLSDAIDEERSEPSGGVARPKECGFRGRKRRSRDGSRHRGRPASATRTPATTTSTTRDRPPSVGSDEPTPAVPPPHRGRDR